MTFEERIKLLEQIGKLENELREALPENEEPCTCEDKVLYRWLTFQDVNMGHGSGAYPVTLCLKCGGEVDTEE